MNLERQFEEKVQEAMLDQAEDRVEELLQNFAEVVHANLQAYASRHGYDVESTIESVSDVEVERSGGTIRATVGWENPQISRWEFGTETHPVTPTNADVLSFIWSDPPQWVREEFDQGRSSGGQYRSGWRVFLPQTNVEGLPESRAIRDAMNGLRRLLAA